MVAIRKLLLTSLAISVAISSNPVLAANALEIPDSQNDIQFYNRNPSTCNTSSSSSTELVGSTNLEKIFNYMVSKGLTDVQAAGVVGNIAQESGGEPTIVQGGGKSSDPSGISAGWGIIQWTPGSKVLGIAKTAGITGDIATLETQLEIVWWHMNNTSPTGVKNFIEQYKTVNDVEQAVRIYEQKMEGAGIPAIANRIKAAKNALESYGNNPVTTSGSISSSTGCVCTDTSGGTDVVLDPGHSGEDRQGKEIDPSTKLYIGDSSNSPEVEQVWETAEKIKSQLEAKGYTVKMTKNAVSDYKNFVDRANTANEANAKIAVSIHNTSGNFGDAVSGWVTAQKVGGYRTNTEGKNITFNDQPTADKSDEYAKKILEERQKVEGGVQMHDLTFDGRPGLSAGNLSVVQLLSKVPWVYNEVGQSGFNSDKYATGIANGIMAAIKPSGSTDDSSNNSDGCNSAATGDAVKTALNYAWPEYHSPPYLTAKTSYQTAVKDAISKKLYVGGGAHPGIDCGGFVTRVMQDSQVDPDYNKSGGPTTAQESYMSSSSKYTKLSVSSTADLKPGDIAVNEKHTYMYVGPGLTGSDDSGNSKEFGSSIASASYGNGGTSWRAPMAGHEQPADPKYRWYRFVGEPNGE